MIPARRLASSSVNPMAISPEGRRALARCGARSITPLRTGKVITQHTRKAFEKALGMSTAEVGLRTIYEVMHNSAANHFHQVAIFLPLVRRLLPSSRMEIGGAVEDAIRTARLTFISRTRARVQKRRPTGFRLPRGPSTFVMRLYAPKSEALTGKWNPRRS